MDRKEIDRIRSEHYQKMGIAPRNISFEPNPPAEPNPFVRVPDNYSALGDEELFDIAWKIMDAKMRAISREDALAILDDEMRANASQHQDGDPLVDTAAPDGVGMRNPERHTPEGLEGGDNPTNPGEDEEGHKLDADGKPLDSQGNPLTEVKADPNQLQMSETSGGDQENDESDQNGEDGRPVIPESFNYDDHASMTWNDARKLARAIKPGATVTNRESAYQIIEDERQRRARGEEG